MGVEGPRTSFGMWVLRTICLIAIVVTVLTNKNDLWVLPFASFLYISMAEVS
jgi:hypothetical protein